jgi:hypothetical protein
MSLIDTYRKKLELQIEEHKVQLDLLKAKARQVAAQSKIELAQADKHLAKAKVRFKQLQTAGGQALTDIKAGLSQALGDLQSSTKKAARHFDSPPATKKARRSSKQTRTGSVKSKKRQ